MTPLYWIQTYSGKKFDLINPTPAMVDIESVVHSLSTKARFGGHCKRFYSVLEHSIRAAFLLDTMSFIKNGDVASKALFKEALLHDAAEAYYGDILGPFKSYLRSDNEGLFPTTIDGIEAAVALRFKIPYPVSKEVNTVDKAMLVLESCNPELFEPSSLMAQYGLSTNPPLNVLESLDLGAAWWDITKELSPTAMVNTFWEILKQKDIDVYEQY